MNHSILKTLSLSVLALAVLSARADILWLRGGEKLVGTVLSEQPDKVMFDSQSLGKLEIGRAAIERIERTATPSVVPEGATNNLDSIAIFTSTNLPLPWLEALAGSDTFDWVQLKSGEWLAGKIKSLQDEKLEFDSEELDLHVFDWKDIRTVRSPRLLSVRFEQGKPVDGALLITTNKVFVFNETATNVYPRSELLAVAPTGAREVDKWSGKISVGVTFRAGNTKETDVNAHASLERRTPATRLTLDYLGNYGRVNGAETEDTHRVTAQFDSFLSRRLYVRVPDIEYYRDPLQNIEHRLTVGGGAGYDLIRTGRTEWDVTVGPAWQANWFGSVEPGQDSFANSLAMVVSTRLDIELSRRVDLIAEYRGQLTSPETGNNTHHAIATLAFEIRKRLKLDLSFVWDRINSPKTESSGITPTPDDFQLITSLGVDF